jgi:hypothetical protein
MPFNVFLRSESGEVFGHVSDENEYLLDAVLRAKESDRGLLRYLDMNGCVVFNQQQMKEIVQEIETLKTNGLLEWEGDTINGIQDLARRGGETVHLFLWFSGD